MTLPPNPPRRPPPRTQHFKKPPLRVQTTTLWEYPSQHYGEGMQGNKNYVGATPSWVIWNVLQRYSREGDTVLDPMCGSGTTLDVARDLNRRGLGFDVNPTRADIVKADARKLPVERESVDVFFVDPPYSDHIHYSEEKGCIGKLSAFDPAYFEAMRGVFEEANRVLKPGGTFALYVCDYFEKKRGFAPVGFGLYSIFTMFFEPLDAVAVVRHNKDLEKGNYHQAAERENFFLRGFNHLFLARKPLAPQPAPRRRR